ncbi:MAG: response regulator [Xenococcaceae cyanobacterium MO_188.B29]|nr:response regulator [Xenococcaceae cyanobacterium MO_188.B29]
MDSLSTNGFNFQFDLNDHNILIVDDNPTNLAVIVDYLEDSGLTILVSQDGESSLKRAKYAKPGIILLDVLMPGIDGYETCRRLKADLGTKDIPVIFMTALSSTEDKVKGFEVGAVDYVTKPIQPEEVLARIKLHLQLRFMTQTLARQNELLTVEIEQRKLVEARLHKINDKLQTEVRDRINAEKALSQLNEELEKRVEVRTLELRKTNHLLHQEIIDRKQAETKVRNSLQEKEVLLKEIYHRVKNNLLVVSSMLELQASCIEEPEIIRMFQNSQNRLHSMALVHEQLYRSQNLKELDLSKYIAVLAEKLADSYDITEQGINFLLDTELIYLNIETAHSCGLIINELIANALEHAFPNCKTGNIWVSLKRDNNNQDYPIVLQVKDDGVGIPEDFDFFNSDSLGLKLVRILTRQIEGEIEILTTNGTCFTITFSELDYRDRL